MNATTQVTAKANGSALDRETLVARLKKAGELQVLGAEALGADQSDVDSYFDPKMFRFHAPDGFETDYAGLTNYNSSDDPSLTKILTIEAHDP